MRKPFVRVVLLTFGCALVAPAAAAAEDFTVNDDMSGIGPPGANCGTPDFTTLQDAEDAGTVNGGDRILVCAGTYDSGDAAPAVDDNKGLVWKGAQAGVDARNRSAPDNEESIVSDPDGGFDVSVADATVDGFLIRDEGNIPFGVAIETSDGGQTVDNNIIDGAGDGIYTDSNGDSTTVIERNWIFNTEDGIHSDEELGNVEIDDNLIEIGGVGMLLHPEFGVSDVDIGGNELQNLSAGVVLEDATGISIFGNTIADVGAGVVLEPESEGILIEDNAIGASSAIGTSGNGPGSGVGIVFASEDSGDTEDTEMIGNTIVGNEIGILAEDAAIGGGIEAHFNRIAGNQFEVETTPISGGIVNQNPLEQIDATNNWFGCNEGPNEDGCDTVEGNVLFDPWLVMDVTAKTHQVKPNQSTKVRASLNQNSDDEDLPTCLFPRGTEIDFTSTKKGEVDPESDGTNLNCKATTKFFAGPEEGKAKVKAFLDAEKVKDVIQIRKP